MTNGAAHYMTGRKMPVSAARKRMATMFKLYGVTGINGHNPANEIKMVVSDWYRDTDGLMTRTIRQADE